LEKFRFRDRNIADEIVERLSEMDLDIKLMHVCGTHQDTLIRFGLDSLLRDVGVEIRQGPGCPVCVTTQKEIEEATLLARMGKTVVTFGDMLRVPGERYSLADMKTEGYDVRIVYSVEDAVGVAKEKETVFIGIGFETTAPTTASAIVNEPPPNFSLLSCHRLIPPAMAALVEMGEVRIQGLIDPGHVSTIIGGVPYEFISQRYSIPQVIAGFEPLDLLIAVYMLAKQIKNGDARVENEYTRSVRYEGNKKAMMFMGTVFEECNLKWRGFPMIKSSGLKLRKEFEEYDARIKYEDELSELEGREFNEPKGCRCGDVLRGVIYPEECPLFGKVCTYKHPVGPCMVSKEGNCNIMLRYRSRNKFKYD
jgi:hydrogenase expression/formation protein HypD